MRVGSDCRGKCTDCLIHYSGGNCFAGRGDDYFTPLTIEEAKIMVSSKAGLYEKAQEWLDKHGFGINE